MTDDVITCEETAAPSIMDMLKEGIRQAWTDKDWPNLVALCNVHLLISQSPAAQPPRVVYPNLPRKVDALEAATAELETELSTALARLAILEQKLTVLEFTLEQESQHIDSLQRPRK